MSLKEIRERVDQHRKEAMITCEETCLCWELEATLSLIDRARECLEKICDMQQKHYGNGMMTHMALSEMCEEARQLLRELEV